MNDFKTFSPISRAVIVIAAIAVALSFLHAAASIVSLTLLAAFIAVIVTSPLNWLLRSVLNGDYRLPTAKPVS